MKKIAIAALAALTAVSLTACGNKDKNNDDSRWFTPTEDPTGGEDAISADAQLTAAEDAPAGTEVQTSAEDERVIIELVDPDEEVGSKAETSAGASAQAKGAVFSFSADSELWTVSEDRKSTSIIYNGDDIGFAKGNCSIMINTREIEDMPDRTLSEVADAIVDSKGLTDLVEIKSRGESSLNGHIAYTMSCTYTISEVVFDLDITVMAEGTDVLEVWVMSYEECTEAMQDNFDKVLKTIEFVG